jgi:hypothetical protein
MNFYSFLVSLCIAASIFSVSHALDKDPPNSVNRFRRLVKNQVTLKMIQPYTQINEEDAVRRLIQNGGSMQDVIDLSLEYQDADEKVRRLVSTGLFLGNPHNRFSHTTYTHSRFNDFPTVLRVVKDGASYVVDLFVQMMKAGKSFGHIIRSFNNITNAETLDWFRNFAAVDTSKLKTTACATYEINACLELMSPAVFDTYRNTENTLDSKGNPVPGLYNAYFGSHACTAPTAPNVTSYVVTGCNSTGGDDGSDENCIWNFNQSELYSAWDTWTNAAMSQTQSMSIDWDEEGETVKECDKVMKFNCEHYKKIPDDQLFNKNCTATIQSSGSGHLTANKREDPPASDLNSKDIKVSAPEISTRNIFTQLVYKTGSKAGAVYRTCDAKVIEMYERIKFQITEEVYKSTSGCTSKVYEASSVDTNHVW